MTHTLWASLCPSTFAGRGNAEMKPTITPFSQGDLDCLCGLYAIINTVHYLRGPLGIDHATGLASSLTRELAVCDGLEDVMAEGMLQQRLVKLMASPVIAKFSLRRYKPFHRRSDVALDEFWQTIATWTANNGVVIMGDAWHWTLVRAVSGDRLYLFDSSHRHWITKSTLVARETSGELYPHYCHFVCREEDAHVPAKN